MSNDEVTRLRTRKACEVPPAFVLLKEREEGESERERERGEAEHTGEYLNCHFTCKHCKSKNTFLLFSV